MKRSRTRTGEGRTNGRTMLFGICLTVIIFFSVSLIGAVITSRTENPTSMIGIISTCALYITAAISGLVISRYKGEGGVLPSSLCALAFTLVLLIISVIINGGHVPAITAINLGAYILISVVFAIFGKRRAPRRRRR